MSDAQVYQDEANILDFTAVAAITGGQILQLPDGRAARSPVDRDAGALASASLFEIVTVPKTANIALLDGGKVYWDHSANKAHFKKVNDKDFYLGTAFGDAAAAATECKVVLNVLPHYAIDLARDPFTTVLVGTAAAGGFGYPRILGGARGFYLTATSEAQKVDALSVDGFAPGSKGIIEFAFRMPTGGSGSASDYSVGVASGTHASDADAITQHLFMHLDGNSANINFQSKDGTTTVNAADSTVDYSAGVTRDKRVEVWMDLRTPADAQIYVDGVNVLPATVFDVSAAASDWLLLAHAEKSTGTETGDMIIDWLRARLGGNE